MSTSFGILKSGGEIILENDCLPNGYSDEDFEIVAFRGNSGNIWWKSNLAKFLPSSMKVYPLDNSAQGVYTIGDIIKEVEI
jgi:hypothetical protein